MAAGYLFSEEDDSGRSAVPSASSSHPLGPCDAPRGLRRHEAGKMPSEVSGGACAHKPEPRARHGTEKTLPYLFMRNRSRKTRERSGSLPPRAIQEQLQVLRRLFRRLTHVIRHAAFERQEEELDYLLGQNSVGSGDQRGNICGYFTKPARRRDFWTYTAGLRYLRDYDSSTDESCWSNARQSEGEEPVEFFPTDPLIENNRAAGVHTELAPTTTDAEETFEDDGKYARDDHVSATESVLGESPFFTAQVGALTVGNDLSQRTLALPRSLLPPSSHPLGRDLRGNRKPSCENVFCCLLRRLVTVLDQRGTAASQENLIRGREGRSRNWVTNGGSPASSSPMVIPCSRLSGSGDGEERRGPAEAAHEDVGGGASCPVSALDLLPLSCIKTLRLLLVHPDIHCRLLALEACTILLDSPVQHRRFASLQVPQLISKVLLREPETPLSTGFDPSQVDEGLELGAGRPLLAFHGAHDGSRRRRPDAHVPFLYSDAASLRAPHQWDGAWACAASGGAVRAAHVERQAALKFVRVWTALCRLARRDPESDDRRSGGPSLRPCGGSYCRCMDLDLFTRPLLPDVLVHTVTSLAAAPEEDSSSSSATAAAHPGPGPFRLLGFNGRNSHRAAPQSEAATHRGAAARQGGELAARGSAGEKMPLSGSGGWAQRAGEGRQREGRGGGDAATVAATALQWRVECLETVLEFGRLCPCILVEHGAVSVLVDALTDIEVQACSPQLGPSICRLLIALLSHRYPTGRHQEGTLPSPSYASSKASACAAVSPASGSSSAPSPASLREQFHLPRLRESASNLQGGAGLTRDGAGSRKTDAEKRCFCGRPLSSNCVAQLEHTCVSELSRLCGVAVEIVQACSSASSPLNPVAGPNRPATGYGASGAVQRPHMAHATLNPPRGSQAGAVEAHPRGPGAGAWLTNKPSPDKGHSGRWMGSQPPPAASISAGLSSALRLYRRWILVSSALLCLSQTFSGLVVLWRLPTGLPSLVRLLASPIDPCAICWILRLFHAMLSHAVGFEGRRMSLLECDGLNSSQMDKCLAVLHPSPVHEPSRDISSGAQRGLSSFGSRFPFSSSPAEIPSNRERHGYNFFSRDMPFRFAACGAAPATQDVVHTHTLLVVRLLLQAQLHVVLAGLCSLRDDQNGYMTETASPIPVIPSDVQFVPETLKIDVHGVTSLSSPFAKRLLGRDREPAPIGISGSSWERAGAMYVTKSPDSSQRGGEPPSESRLPASGLPKFIPFIALVRTEAAHLLYALVHTVAAFFPLHLLRHRLDATEVSRRATRPPVEPHTAFGATPEQSPPRRARRSVHFSKLPSSGTQRSVSAEFNASELSSWRRFGEPRHSRGVGSDQLQRNGRGVEEAFQPREEVTAYGDEGRLRRAIGENQRPSTWSDIGSHTAVSSDRGASKAGRSDCLEKVDQSWAFLWDGFQSYRGLLPWGDKRADSTSLTVLSTLSLLHFVAAPIVRLGLRSVVSDDGLDSRADGDAIYGHLHLVLRCGESGMVVRAVEDSADGGGASGPAGEHKPRGPFTVSRSFSRGDDSQDTGGSGACTKDPRLQERLELPKGRASRGEAIRLRTSDGEDLLLTEDSSADDVSGSDGSTPPCFHLSGPEGNQADAELQATSGNHILARRRPHGAPNGLLTSLSPRGSSVYNQREASESTLHRAYGQIEDDILRRLLLFHEEDEGQMRHLGVCPTLKMLSEVLPLIFGDIARVGFAHRIEVCWHAAPCSPIILPRRALVDQRPSPALISPQASVLSAGDIPKPTVLELLAVPSGPESALAPPLPDSAAAGATAACGAPPPSTSAFSAGAGSGYQIAADACLPAGIPPNPSTNRGGTLRHEQLSTSPAGWTSAFIEIVNATGVLIHPVENAVLWDWHLISRLLLGPMVSHLRFLVAFSVELTRLFEVFLGRVLAFFLPSTCGFACLPWDMNNLHFLVIANALVSLLLVVPHNALSLCSSTCVTYSPFPTGQRACGWDGSQSPQSRRGGKRQYSVAPQAPGASAETRAAEEEADGGEAEKLQNLPNCRGAGRRWTISNCVLGRSAQSRCRTAERAPWRPGTKAEKGRRETSLPAPHRGQHALEEAGPGLCGRRAFLMEIAGLLLQELLLPPRVSPASACRCTPSASAAAQRHSGVRSSASSGSLCRGTSAACMQGDSGSEQVSGNRLSPASTSAGSLARLEGAAAPFAAQDLLKRGRATQAVGRGECWGAQLQRQSLLTSSVACEGRVLEGGAPASMLTSSAPCPEPGSRSEGQSRRLGVDGLPSVPVRPPANSDPAARSATEAVRQPGQRRAPLSGGPQMALHSPAAGSESTFTHPGSLGAVALKGTDASSGGEGAASPASAASLPGMEGRLLSATNTLASAPSLSVGGGAPHLSLSLAADASVVRLRSARLVYHVRNRTKAERLPIRLRQRWRRTEPPFSAEDPPGSHQMESVTRLPGRRDGETRTHAEAVIPAPGTDSQSASALQLQRSEHRLLRDGLAPSPAVRVEQLRLAAVMPRVLGDDHAHRTLSGQYGAIVGTFSASVEGVIQLSRAGIFMLLHQLIERGPAKDALVAGFIPHLCLDFRPARRVLSSVLSRGSLFLKLRCLAHWERQILDEEALPDIAEGGVDDCESDLDENLDRYDGDAPSSGREPTRDRYTEEDGRSQRRSEAAERGREGGRPACERRQRTGHGSVLRHPSTDSEAASPCLRPSPRGPTPRTDVNAIAEDDRALFSKTPRWAWQLQEVILKCLDDGQPATLRRQALRIVLILCTRKSRRAVRVILNIMETERVSSACWPRLLQLQLLRVNEGVRTALRDGWLLSRLNEYIAVAHSYEAAWADHDGVHAARQRQRLLAEKAEQISTEGALAVSQTCAEGARHSSRTKDYAVCSTRSATPSWSRGEQYRDMARSQRPLRPFAYVRVMEYFTTKVFDLSRIWETRTLGAKSLDFELCSSTSSFAARECFSPISSAGASARRQSSRGSANVGYAEPRTRGRSPVRGSPVPPHFPSLQSHVESPVDEAPGLFPGLSAMQAAEAVRERQQSRPPLPWVFHLLQREDAAGGSVAPARGLKVSHEFQTGSATEGQGQMAADAHSVVEAAFAQLDSSAGVTGLAAGLKYRRGKLRKGAGGPGFMWMSHVPGQLDVQLVAALKSSRLCARVARANAGNGQALSQKAGDTTSAGGEDVGNRQPERSTSSRIFRDDGSLSDRTGRLARSCRTSVPGDDSCPGNAGNEEENEEENAERIAAIIREKGVRIALEDGLVSEDALNSRLVILEWFPLDSFVVTDSISVCQRALMDHACSPSTTGRPAESPPPSPSSCRSLSSPLAPGKRSTRKIPSKSDERGKTSRTSCYSPADAEDPRGSQSLGGLSESDAGMQAPCVTGEKPRGWITALDGLIDLAAMEKSYSILSLINQERCVAVSKLFASPGRLLADLRARTSNAAPCGEPGEAAEDGAPMLTHAEAEELLMDPSAVLDVALRVRFVAGGMYADRKGHFTRDPEAAAWEYLSRTEHITSVWEQMMNHRACGSFGEAHSPQLRKQSHHDAASARAGDRDARNRAGGALESTAEGGESSKEEREDVMKAAIEKRSHKAFCKSGGADYPAHSVQCWMPGEDEEESCDERGTQDPPAAVPCAAHGRYTVGPVVVRTGNFRWSFCLHRQQEQVRFDTSDLELFRRGWDQEIYMLHLVRLDGQIVLQRPNRVVAKPPPSIISYLALTQSGCRVLFNHPTFLPYLESVLRHPRRVSASEACAAVWSVCQIASTSLGNEYLLEYERQKQLRQSIERACASPRRRDKEGAETGANRDPAVRFTGHLSRTGGSRLQNPGGRGCSSSLLRLVMRIARRGSPLCLRGSCLHALSLVPECEAAEAAAVAARWDLAAKGPLQDRIREFLAGGGSDRGSDGSGSEEDGDSVPEKPRGGDEELEKLGASSAGQKCDRDGCDTAGEKEKKSSLKKDKLSAADNWFTLGKLVWAPAFNPALPSEERTLSLAALDKIRGRHSGSRLTAFGGILKSSPSSTRFPRDFCGPATSADFEEHRRNKRSVFGFYTEGSRARSSSCPQQETKEGSRSQAPCSEEPFSGTPQEEATPVSSTRPEGNRKSCGSLGPKNQAAHPGGDEAVEAPQKDQHEASIPPTPYRGASDKDYVFGQSPSLAIFLNGRSRPCYACFGTQHWTVLQLISKLPNSVAVKIDGLISRLQLIKQRNPEIFLSVELWWRVEQLMCLYRFPAHLRRIVASLFDNTFSDPAALSYLDILSDHVSQLQHVEKCRSLSGAVITGAS
ncbi:hypothetical protein BESB_058540 [Besnoitia besnoiti]|uniref:Rapamycin-insensitive companion of mTOR N-terminal domain-containing protein n=1 Tax=Besnoitia besnoiti TaxID=94643 RepID=A0A2A9MHA3_BESBE|nr:hypothetical protein BESB_058540 [Besnoitia besnoiti]PFH34967.1 hypothetical protein BESB_058540 [Besnoitia besnoiti]